MNTLLYDSRDPRCKSPFGALPTGTPVSFSIFLPVQGEFSDPVLLLYYADEWETPAARLPMLATSTDGMHVEHHCEFSHAEPQLFFYRFELKENGRITRICRGSDGTGVLDTDGNSMWQLTVYDANMNTPDFLRQGVMYQIFPDRFCASGTPKSHVPDDRWLHGDWYELPEFRPNAAGEVTNSDCFGGDLAGIQQKLPYLKSLGVTVLYLNPVFEAHSNHRYDTADYEKIDPLLGTEEDLRTLCATAKEMGIHVILDGVFNHTGSDSVYFNKKGRYGNTGAYRDPESPYRPWYDFIHYPEQYQSWWGFTTLPSLNENNPDYSNFICGENGVLKKWLRVGISGWRLDVADELPDSFLDRICASVRETDPQAAVIGEVWEDASIKFAYGVRRRYLLGNQLDSVMNYPFKDAILSFVRNGNGMAFYDTVLTIMEHYPKPVLDVLMNSLSTHDVERVLTTLAGDPIGQNGRDWQAAHHRLNEAQYEKGKRLLRLAALLQYTLPGIPCLYYGDEAGLYGYKDPFNRACYPWGREDEQLLSLFTALGRLRTDYPGLSDGGFHGIRFGQNVAVYLRSCGSHTLLIAVNRGESATALPMPPAFETAEPVFGHLEDGALPPLGCVVLALPGLPT